jgi:hypothetical protein
MSNLTINDNAPSSLTVGEQLEYLGPGHNFLNVEVRRPGSRKSLFLAKRWLTGLDAADNLDHAEPLIKVRTKPTPPPRLRRMERMFL